MKKMLAIILVILIVWLQYRAWYGENSLREIDLLITKIENQKVQNELILEQNKSFKKEIALLRNEPSMLEEKARENLGLIKKDEIFYRIIPAEK